MATKVILPALGMAQETAIITQWLKREGEAVTKGEPLLEIETDKARVEIEAQASGVLAKVTAAVGDEIPVGQVIATILSPDEAAPRKAEADGAAHAAAAPSGRPGASSSKQPLTSASTTKTGRPAEVAASPLASRMAAEHHLDLHVITPAGKRVQKADVLTYLQQQEAGTVSASAARLVAASPKARRLAAEYGTDVASIAGTGPGGAVLTADVLAAIQRSEIASAAEAAGQIAAPVHELAISNIWRIMAERTTQSWTSIPHFYLAREVNASRLIAWREQAQKRTSADVT